VNEVSTLCSTVCFSNNMEIGIDYIEHLNQQNESKHIHLWVLGGCDCHNTGCYSWNEKETLMGMFSFSSESW